MNNKKMKIHPPSHGCETQPQVMWNTTESDVEHETRQEVMWNTTGGDVKHDRR